MEAKEVIAANNRNDILLKLQSSLDEIQKLTSIAHSPKNKQKEVEEMITFTRFTTLLHRDILLSNELLSKIQSCIQSLSFVVQNMDNCPFYASACEIICTLQLLEYNKQNNSNNQRKIANNFLATKMALRATKSWIKLKNTTNANRCLDLTIQSMKLLKDNLTGGGSFTIHKTNVEKCETIAALYQLELISESGDYEGAFSMFSEIKTKTYEFENLQTYLGNICYNNGIRCFKEGFYEWSVNWLRQCYGLLKGECFNSQKQTVILRVLSEAYISWDASQYWRKALHAIDLIYAGKKTNDYFLDSLHIILQGGEECHLDEFLTKIKDFVDQVDVAFYTKVAKMLLNYGYCQQAIAMIRSIRSETAPFTQLSHLMVLELKICLDNGSYKEGKMIAKEYLKKLKDEKCQRKNTDFIPDHRVCLLCLTVASKEFKEERFGDALVWYDSCIEFHHLVKISDKEEHIYWLKRQACYCHIEVNNFNEAKEILNELRSIGPENDLNKLLEIKIGFGLEDRQMLESTLDYFDRRFRKENPSNSCLIHPSGITKVVVECVSVALVNNQTDFSLKVLEKLLSSKETIKNNTMKMKLLQCLLRLLLNNIGNDPVNYEKCLQCIRKSEECLEIEQQVDEIKNEQFCQECLWFAKTCWNLSIQPNVPVRTMYQLFTMSWKFLHKIQPSGAVSTQKTNCLLMVLSTGMAVARESRDETTREEIVCAVLHLLAESKKTKEIIKHNRRLLQMILLYEFEAMVMIKCPTLANFFEEVTSFSELDAKFFELLATVVMEHGPSHYQLAANSLKMAIKKYGEEPADFVQLSRNYHSLVQITLEELMNNERDTYQEAMIYINQLLEFLQETGKNYPEIELVWTMVKCWNCGIQYLLRQDLRSAFEWCSISMKFLKYVGSFEVLYLNKMTELFNDLFDVKKGNGSSPH